jgi:SAM-dependent methyltransferase
MVNIIHYTLSNSVKDEQAIEVFQHQWRIYKKMVDSDYFAHREVYAIVQRVLTDRFEQPFRFLDLACGDAGGVVEALRHTAVSHYHGIDLSKAALELASRNLENLRCTVVLEERDFIEAMNERPEPADFVWMGLSLHHLTPAAKKELMAGVRNAIGNNGLFLIYEPTLRAGETREAYLDRAERSIRSWRTVLAGGEMEEVVQHVRTCDLPETSETWKTLALRGGFGRARKLFDGPADLFALFSFAPK